ncbi:TrkH family potassium uptake protein [Candidatus Undinarchaeota archaeon]
MRNVLYYTGISLFILGILLSVPILAAVALGEPIMPFAYAAAISMVVGFTLMKSGERENLSMARAFLFATVIFLLMPLIGSIPYLLTPSFSGTFLDAYFESMSGFTTTGLSVITNLESLPMSLLVWRSFTQWIGGIGIVVLFLTILFQPGISSYYLSKAEGKDQRIWPSIVKTSREQFLIYLFYTVAGAGIFVLIGMPLFDSFTHIFATVSTGGFSSHALSIEAIESVGNPILVDSFVILFMIIGSTSFLLHSKLLRGGYKQYAKSPEVKLFYLIIAMSTLVLAYDQYLLNDPHFFKHAIFQSVSALTTTGFISTDLTTMSNLGKYIIIILMVLGGSSGSTSGGIKMIRVLIFLKSLSYAIKKAVLPPETVLPFKLGGEKFEAPEVLMLVGYSLLYVILLGFGTMIILLDGFTFLEAVFESTSALGTVGMSLGITAKLGTASKIVIILEMLLGRLEILPILGTLMVLTKFRMMRFAK